jgi:hypothetical protein
MKKSDRNLLLAAGAAGLVAYVAYNKKPGGAASVSGIPGVGALLPSTGTVANLLPEKWRGQPTPLWLDAALWGSLGAAAGYYGLAGKKLPF